MAKYKSKTKQNYRKKSKGKGKRRRKSMKKKTGGSAAACPNIKENIIYFEKVIDPCYSRPEKYTGNLIYKGKKVGEYEQFSNSFSISLQNLDKAYEQKLEKEIFENYKKIKSELEAYYKDNEDLLRELSSENLPSLKTLKIISNAFISFDDDTAKNGVLRHQFKQHVEKLERLQSNINYTKGSSGSTTFLKENLSGKSLEVTNTTVDPASVSSSETIIADIKIDSKTVGHIIDYNYKDDKISEHEHVAIIDGNDINIGDVKTELDNLKTGALAPLFQVDF
tara:strand:+ start:294 stop:1133 length:840 start_codon:yes stop_codon:yes gene_type:complete